ncbi:MAG: ATP-binding protein [Flavobacteriaceae bacterium]
MISMNLKEDHEEIPPRADAMICSLRAFGYDLPMAIADLIDNSISAKANNISVDYDWNDGSPWIRITDDGEGMHESRLREAMRMGSTSPLEARDAKDLGRFGLGLKTASFSQGKLLSVCSKTIGGKEVFRSWDLDVVCAKGKWLLSKRAPEKSEKLLKGLESLESGTIVLCQKLDRVSNYSSGDEKVAMEGFLEKFDHVAKYLEMVFHRFLSGKNRIVITVGRHVCKAWDPFLEKNTFTQVLSSEILDRNRVQVKPFVLPHVSKRTLTESAEGAGTLGWNAQQGLYIYRNKRMIIHGGYLDLPFSAEEHYKLCRIQVDLSTDLDHEWSVDVRKAAASPPPKVRADLERIARATRSLAANVYRARAGRTKSKPTKINKHDVWIRRKKAEKILYQINKENEAISRILSEINPSKSWVNKLFHLIQSKVPHRRIIIDNSETEDCQVNLPPDLSPPPQELIDVCIEIFRDRLKMSGDVHSAADYACSFFDDHPQFRASLDPLIEELLC